MPASIRMDRLANVVELAMKKMEGRRKVTRALKAEYAGSYYADARETNPRPLNLIHSAVNVLVPNLVARNPKFRIRSENLVHRGHALLSEGAINHVVKKVGYDRTLRNVVIDAVFGAGITRTDIGASGYMTQILDSRFDLGVPFVDRVSIDDFVLDPFARHLGEASFIGHRYRVPRSYLLESGLFPASSVDAISRWEDRDTGDAAAMQSDTLSSPSRPTGEENDLLDLVPLMDLYLPYDHIVITIPGSRPMSQQTSPENFVLREIPYDGPESEAGPYDVLGFHWLPDNPMPIPPASIWFDLHVSANMLMRKVSRQANRQKTVLAYTPEASEDAQTIVDAEDGQSVRVRDVNLIKEVNFGGAPDESYQFLAWTADNFSKMAGNIDQMGGLSSGVNTATQAEILQGNASSRLLDMQDATYKMAEAHGRKIWFILESDPFIQMPMVQRVGGIDVTVDYNPQSRTGDFHSFYFSVEPYSLQRQPPQEKAKRKADWAANVYLPILGATMESLKLGVMVNPNPLLLSTGRDFNIEEIDEMLLDIDGLRAQMEMATMYAPDKGGPNMQSDPSQPTGRQPGIPGGAGMEGGMDTGRGSFTRGSADGAGARFQGA